MKRDNPLHHHSAEADFARDKGWQVVLTSEEFLIIPPLDVKIDYRLRQRFKTIEGAWGAAAQRAGYRPLAEVPGPELRPHVQARARNRPTGRNGL